VTPSTRFAACDGDAGAGCSGPTSFQSGQAITARNLVRGGKSGPRQSLRLPTADLAPCAMPRAGDEGMLLGRPPAPGHGIIDRRARSLALNPDVSSSRPITASISSSFPSSAVLDPSMTAVRASACRIFSWGFASASANRE